MTEKPRGRTDASRGPVQRALLLALALAAACMALVAPGTAWAVNSPPKVTKQPIPVTDEEGATATFTSTASGTPTPTVQWEVSTNGGSTYTPISGATSTTYTIAGTRLSENGDKLRAVFTNVAGTATSTAVLLSVHRVAYAATQPANTTVEEGQNAQFEATGGGSTPLTAQWQVSATGGASWLNISGATSNVLVLTAVTRSLNGHLYRVYFKNTYGIGYSEPATLTVQKLPAVTKQPANTTTVVGHSVSFEATASGFPTPTVQWEISTDGGFSFTPIAGATSTTYTIASAEPSEDGYQFRAVFTNAAGSATSEAAKLTVHTPPQVTLEPSSVTVEAGEEASFESSATGFPAPTEQWEVSSDGGGTWTPIGGATSEKLTIASTVVAESGDEFRAVFTSSAGSAASAPATLTVATNHFSAVGWGSNLSRQLGAGLTTAFVNVPVSVVGLKFVTDISAGGRHSLALLANGTVQAWGNDEYGQTGNGGGVTVETPAEVTGLTSVSAVEAGGAHSLALRKNGTVMAWGDNESGQLGTGSIALGSETPTEVKGLTGVKQISAGGEHSLALLSNGTVMAWGNNESGELGDGSTKGSNVPVAVKGLTKVIAVSAGGDFSLALLSTGAVEAWGSNASGQLGNGSEEEFSDVPVAVSGLSNVTAVSAGSAHALALLGTRAVMAWGEDTYGEIGNGTTKAAQGTPVEVTGLSGVNSVSAGGAISAAVLSSGSVMAWGNDKAGAMGNGTNTGTFTTPVAVSGLAKVAEVSAGAAHMLAFGEPLPAVTGVSPTTGPVAGGTTVTISGANLEGATAVKFGTVEATEVKAESATTVVATAPPGSPGTVNVTVTVPGGTSATNAADRYTYENPPSVTKVSPALGPAGGGTSVTITGTEFTGATQVSFGGTAATSYKVNSATSITATAPAGAAGVVDVRVTNPIGTSPIATKDHFRYQPTITLVSPSSGTTAGGTSVEITGTGFALGSATVFKFKGGKATSVNCTSSTTCTMLTPPGAAETVNVVATANGSSSAVTSASKYTYV